VQWLVDHGESDKDESIDGSNNTDSTTSCKAAGELVSSNRNQYKELFGLDYYASTADLLRPQKRAKLENVSSITIGYLASRKGSRKSKHWKRLRVLLDSGCGATLINQSLVGNLKI
jgi:hypothetical protein